MKTLFCLVLFLLLAPSRPVLGQESASAENLAWLAESRKQWLASSEAKSWSVASSSDLSAQGLREFVFVVLGEGSEMLTRARLRVESLDGTSSSSLKLGKEGRVYRVLPEGQYRIWASMPKGDSVGLGVFSWPRTPVPGGVLRVDLVADRSTTSGARALFTFPFLGSSRRAQGTLTPTSAAVGPPPERIVLSSVEELRQQRRIPAVNPEGDSPSRDLSEPGLPGQGVQGGNAEAGGLEAIDEVEASRFETQGLPSRTDDPELRRIWRLIANADSEKSKGAAQRALAEHYAASGREDLARRSLARAEFWDRRVESLR